MENKNFDKIEKELKDKEESELEEEIKEEEETIEIENFHEFIQQPIENLLIQDTSPSLEQINISSEVPIRLEQGLAGSHFTETTNKENSSKYNFTTNQEDEPKYQSHEEQTFTPKRTEIENLGRTEFSQRQEIGFMPSQERSSTTQENYINPKAQEIEKLGRNENPFERKEIKYKPIK